MRTSSPWRVFVMAGALAALGLAVGCEACGNCVGDALTDRVVPHAVDGGAAVPACPLPAAKRSLVGTWRGPDFLLVVSEDCRALYRRNGSKVSAPLMEFFGDDFSVGIFGIGTTFRVSAMPRDVGGGVWKMIVDGVELTKSPEDPAAVIGAENDQ